MKYHLAQANIARFKAPLTDPLMKEFVDFLEPINKLAEESPGFIWRLKDDEGRSASYIQSPFQDEMMAVNISLWKDVTALNGFVYHTVHRYFLRNKKKWFDLTGPSEFVMWWLPEGELPNLHMAKDRLQQLKKNGPSLTAFNTKKIYDSKGNKIVQR